MTFNGIGFRYLNASSVDEDGCYMADKWFTFLYLPILPLKRMKMKRAITKSNTSQIDFISESKIDSLAKIKTLALGWFIYPAIIFWPLPMVVIEVYTALGLPENMHSWAFAFAIIYMLVAVWILADQYEEQGLPKNYRQILRDQKKTNLKEGDK